MITGKQARQITREAIAVDGDPKVIGWMPKVENGIASAASQGLRAYVFELNGNTSEAELDSLRRLGKVLDSRAFTTVVMPGNRASLRIYWPEEPCT